MVELISRVWIHNSVRHHTELFEKSNKIKKGKTHSKPATKRLETFAISILWRKGREICFGKKSPSVQTLCVSFCKPLFNLSFEMATKKNSEIILLLRNINLLTHEETFNTSQADYSSWFYKYIHMLAMPWSLSFNTVPKHLLV